MAGFRITRPIDVNKVAASVEAPLVKGMTGAAELMRREAAAAIRSTPSPSPEGGPPGSDTGAMADAIRGAGNKRGGGGAIGVVGPLDNAEQYAALTRLITGFAGRDAAGRNYVMLPRPLYEPIFRQHAAELAQLIAGG